MCGLRVWLGRHFRGWLFAIPMALLTSVAWGQTYFRVTPEGKIGIGMEHVPKGDTGEALVGIDGTDANGGPGSVTGPNMQFTTNRDNYPLLQILPGSHNNMSLNFDAYWEGASWKSSVYGVAFQLIKSETEIKFRRATSQDPGAPIVWNDVLSIDDHGCVVAGSTPIGQCSSDFRLKRNITAMSPDLDAVSKLKFVEFDYRSDQYPSRDLPTGRQSGVIAQEVQQVMPDLVSADADGMLRVDYSKLDTRIRNAVVELVRVNQKQSGEIEQMHRELAALQAQMRMLAPVNISASIAGEHR